MNRRTALAVAVVPLVAVTLVDCGSRTASTPTATHGMADGQTMSGSSMVGMTGTRQTAADRHAPSAAASMVCRDEIRTAVAHTLQLDRAPRGLHSWGHGLFRCSYLLGAGELRISVEDLDAPGPGRAYFEALRHRLPHAVSLRGVEALGFPSFQTRRGDVVFLKDDKTLRVDAGRLSLSALPDGMSRTEVAYGVAAAVIACWSE